MKKYFVKITLILGLVILGTSIKAQPWMDNIADKNNPNFFEIQKAFYDYWNSKGIDLSKKHGKESEDKDLAGYYQFKRWEWFISPRVSPTGELPNPMSAYNEYIKQQSLNNDRVKNITNINANWTPLGPFAVPAPNSGQHGAGRLNCVTVNPLNGNVLYVGSPAGGFWKSVDGGNTWATTTDLLSTLGVTDIAIDPTDTSIVFIATGDSDAQDTYSCGVMKSTDGGLTWSTTGLNWTQSQYRYISRLIINPSNVNTMIAGTSNGIMRTTNGGTTWVSTLNAGGIRDVVFKPADPNIVYACSSNNVYRSTNGGATYSLINSGLPTTGIGRIQIAVTANDSNYVYALLSASADASFYGLYRSTNGGTSWTLMSNSPNILGFNSDGSSSGGQGWYDLALAVSPTSKNTVMVGGINAWRSTNGGSSWTCVGLGYNNTNSSSHIHPDVHRIVFQPGSGTVVYCANDGGIFKSTNTGTAWADKSSGLQIMEFYGMATAQTSSTICLGGAQDNGANLYNAGTWTNVQGGDAMITQIDYTNANYMYEEFPYGDITMSTNGGSTWNDITPNGQSGAWVTPFIIDPTSHSTLYVGYSDIFKTTNYGNTWTQISTSLAGGNTIEAIAVAPSNSNYIYAGAGGQTTTIAACNSLYKSTTGGAPWTSISAGLPLSIAPLTGIAVKSNDPNTLWVTLSGYSSFNKVFKSTNGGATWTNVTLNFPNVPANCIAYLPNVPANPIYVGTDLGVWYTDDALGYWVQFNNGLPNVIVNDLKIQTSAGLLRAGTYGRGLWSTPLYITTDVPVITSNNHPVKIYPNPTSGEVYIDLPSSNINSDISVFNVVGEKITDVSIESQGESKYTLNLGDKPKGIYFIRIQTEQGLTTEKLVLMK